MKQWFCTDCEKTYKKAGRCCGKPLQHVREVIPALGADEKEIKILGPERLTLHINLDVGDMWEQEKARRGSRLTNSEFLALLLRQRDTPMRKFFDALEALRNTLPSFDHAVGEHETGPGKLSGNAKYAINKAIEDIGHMLIMYSQYPEIAKADMDFMTINRRLPDLISDEQLVRTIIMNVEKEYERNVKLSEIKVGEE